MIYYVCKYTPVELLRGFGAECRVFDESPDNFELGERESHANLCGFGKSVLQAALSGRIDELVLVNCCDVMRRVYDVIRDKKCCRFLYMLDLPHTDSECQLDRFAREIERLFDAYAGYSGRSFDRELFLASFETPVPAGSPYAALIGARVGQGLESMLRSSLSVPVRNLTCVGAREVPLPPDMASNRGDDIFRPYASALLRQLPCRRMEDHSARRALFEDPALLGVVYHTMKFCDYYGLEYSAARTVCRVPMTKIETDCTLRSNGQLRTRLDAFAETLGRTAPAEVPREGKYYAGIDSGSASTDAVIIDLERNIVGFSVLPTGGGASKSGAEALDAALSFAGISREQLARVVSTGYGRGSIGGGDDSVTEITCHAAGAHFLLPSARTVIDIGGQDSKVISIDGRGKVLSFAMNDKCAAGTGRFLEMMARALGLTLDEMGKAGLKWKNDIPISSTCTVFAESEVVSLVAQNRDVADIVHGLNNSVAARAAALMGRLRGAGEYIMTGGVAKNAGVVRAIEERLCQPVYVCGEAQICGALGAALIAGGFANL